VRCRQVQRRTLLPNGRHGLRRWARRRGRRANTSSTPSGEHNKRRRRRRGGGGGGVIGVDEQQYAIATA